MIDESDLDAIGLSIFSFPTLSHFFVAPRSQQFVREATLEDLGASFLEIRQIILSSEELSSTLPTASSREESFGAIFGKLTRSQIEAEAHLPRQFDPNSDFWSWTWGPRSRSSKRSF